MFHYIHDMPGVPDSVYLADNAFADNPWVLNKTGVMIANNDNIERIDVYPLDAKLTEYLQDAHSSYFAQEAHVTSAANGWKMIGGQLPVQSSVQSVRQAEQEAEAPQEEQKNPMHISIGRNSEGRYVLTWDWKPGAAAATITLYGGGQRLFSRVVTNAEYSMSVGSSPQGVDVTTALSGVGFVQVSVFYNGAPYAQAEVVGRQNRVVYSTDRDRSGKMVLTVEGAPGDICRTVVQCETEGRTLLYPLYALDDLQRYEGLSLPGNFRLIASPMEKYPYVFAVQK